VQGLLHRAARLPLLLLHVVLFGLAFGESAALLDLVIPGEAGAIFASAALQQRGANLAVAIALCSIGAILGDSAGYLVGRKWGWAAVRRFDWVRRHLEPSVKKAAERLEEKGGPTIFASRWIGALRAVVPLVAGSSELPYRRFVLWEAPAAVLWSAAVVCAGWFLGERAASFVDRWSWAVTALLVVGFVAVWAIRHRRKQTATATA
jgi:membrane protein DedA with SNARE-associated domain